MQSQTVVLRDIENWDSNPPPGIKVDCRAKPEYFRRQRPALVRGNELMPFLHHYFVMPASMPWSGTVEIGPATVTIDGLMIRNSELLIGRSLMYPPQCFPYSHSPLAAQPESGDRWRIDVPQDTIKLTGTTANAICDGWQIYGHWLVDVLPRLERFRNSGIQIDQYLFAGPEREWQLRLIEATGIDLAKCRFIDVGQTGVACDNVVFATYDRYNSEVRPELLNLHRRLVIEYCGTEDREATRALFISRGEWSGSRQLVNRREVEEAARNAGYEVCNPEKLSFADQVRLFNSAKIIAGECGSGLHNAIFSKDSTRVGIIQSNDNLNFLQAQIGLMLNQETYYCIGRTANGANESFEADVADVRYMLHAMRG